MPTIGRETAPHTEALKTSQSSDGPQRNLRSSKSTDTGAQRSILIKSYCALHGEFWLRISTILTVDCQGGTRGFPVGVTRRSGPSERSKVVAITEVYLKEEGFKRVRRLQ